MFTTTRFAGPALLALAAVVMPYTAAAADGKAIVDARCASCHAMAAPAATGLEDRLARKGPPLHYAGDKFRRDWLAAWLQTPQRLRPAGDFYGLHVKPGPDGDVIDEAPLPPHVALAADEAQAVADHLMTLSAKADLLAGIDYEPGTVSRRLGAMNFGKFKGCSSCHSDEDGYGGVTGPELHTAFRRLRPDYVVSYILDPQAWEPHSLMPNQHLQPDDARKLADYLNLIAEDRP